MFEWRFYGWITKFCIWQLTTVTRVTSQAKLSQRGECNRRKYLKKMLIGFSSVSMVIAVWEVFQASVHYVILSSLSNLSLSLLSILHNLLPYTIKVVIYLHSYIYWCNKQYKSWKKDNFKYKMKPSHIHNSLFQRGYKKSLAQIDYGEKILMNSTASFWAIVVQCW